jgi:hypothetical protein
MAVSDEIGPNLISRFCETVGEHVSGAIAPPKSHEDP